MKHFLYFLIILLITATFCNAQKVKPLLKLVNGSTYYYLTSASSAMVQSINGQENKVNLDISMKMAFKVLAATDSTYTTEVSYQSLSMKIQMAAMSMEFNSQKNDSKDLPSTMLAGMMNKPFTIVLTKTGKVKSVENVEKMISSVFDAVPQADTAKKAQIKSQFMQSFGPNAFKGSIEMATAVFPSTAVSKNDKWTVNTLLESPAKADVTTVYQLIDGIGNTWQLHGEGTMVTRKGSKPMVVNGLSMTYDLNGTMISDIKLDKATGWISEAKMKQQMTGSIHIADAPAVPGGMTIPMSFNTDMTTTGK